MPNTKSAERRVRSNVRKQARNRTAESKLKTIERKFLATISEGKPEASAAALKAMHSALDKAAKTGIIRKGTADRKKSRLAIASVRPIAKVAVKGSKKAK